MQAPCVLPAELKIYTISELYAQCVGWIHAPVTEDNDLCLSVNAAAVAEVDAAGVQLLLSLSNSLTAQKRRLQLIAPSQALHAACAAVGAGALTRDVNPKEVQP